MQTWIVNLVSASAMVLGLSLAGCDGGEAKPDEAKPAETKPDEAKPDAAKPDAAKPDEAKPDEAKPDEAKPDEAKPDEATDEAKPDEATDEAKPDEATDEAKPDEAKPDEAKPDEPKPKTKKASKPADTGPKIDGKPLYLSKCKSCHGADGKGKTKFAEKHDVNDLTKTKLSVAKIVKVLKAGVPDTKMKSFSKKLSDDEMKAVAAYVKKL